MCAHHGAPCACRFICFAALPVHVRDVSPPPRPPPQAVLIHGADAMGGSTDPDGERGFGRIHLESALPFDGDGVWALYVEDADGSTTSAGQVCMDISVSRVGRWGGESCVLS